MAGRVNRMQRTSAGDFEVNYPLSLRYNTGKYFTQRGDAYVTGNEARTGAVAEESAAEKAAGAEGYCFAGTLQI